MRVILEPSCFLKSLHGYKMGTPAFAPHKQITKPYQNDKVLQEKPI